MNEPPLHWYHRLFVGLQYLLPQQALSALVYRLVRLRARPLRLPLIRLFIRGFRVDMQEAEEPDPAAYPTFNAFFTRALRPDARPITAEPGALACPADGRLSQFGSLSEGRLVQAKGRTYSLLDLLGGDADWAERFAGGQFATIYLSPRDYHRVHMPTAGRLVAMRHIPGRLFSVNQVTTALVPRLFSRNERLLCLFEGEAGPFAVILVGAIFVGSMATVWAGQVTPRRPDRKPAEGSPLTLDRGEEMGRFNMGSTVILLLPAGAYAFAPELRPGDGVRLGQRLGLSVARSG